MTQLTETINFHANLNVLQNNELQDFIKKLEQSQHISIDLDEDKEIISITGKQTSINTAETQIKRKIENIEKNLTTTSDKPLLHRQQNPNNNRNKQMLTLTIELSVARSHFLEFAGEKYLNSIRKNPDINGVTFRNGQLQLSGQADAIRDVKLHLEQSLYEKTISIPLHVKQHLTKTCYGRMLKEFSKKYHVGTSLQPYQRPHHEKINDKNLHNTGRTMRAGYRGRTNFNTVTHDQQSNRDTQQRGGFRGGYPGRSAFNNVSHSQNSNDSQSRGGFRGASRSRFQRGRGNLNRTHTLPNDDVDNLEENKSTEQYSTSYHPHETTVKSSIDDSDDDSSGQESDSDLSLSSILTNNSITSNSCNTLSEITVCGDDIVSLQEAIEELQNYSLYSESWALTADEYVFIFKQKYRVEDKATKMSIKDRCSRIKYYLRGLLKTICVHMFVFYKRGMWYVTVQGFKYNVSPAILRIKNHLRNIVKAEVQISISKLVAMFIKKKALSTLNELKKIHNVNIELDIPSDDNEQNERKARLNLSASVSAIHIAQSAVQEFLNDLLEKEYEIARSTANLSIGIRTNILNYIKKIEESDDYDAIADVNFHRSSGEQLGTRPKVTLTIVYTNEDTANDIVQQCKDMIEGYDEWTPTLNEYQSLVNLFFVQKRVSLEQFQKEWNAQIYLDKQKSIVKISARSKMVAQEIKEILQNFASGKDNRTNRISVTIHIDFNIRRFVNQAIQSTLDQAKSKRIFIDTKNRNELTLSGRSEDVKPIEETIQTIVNIIQQKIVTNHLQLSFAQSELFRNNSYEILRRIERQTNTLIRDMKFTQIQSASNQNNIDLGNSYLKCVVNNRGQTITVKKGHITKIKHVDAIIFFQDSSAQSYSTDGSIEKTIVSIQIPKYVGDRRQDRSSLFSSISSALQNAEKEKYTSIALPLIYTQLQDWSKTTIIAIKQFFADYPTSHLTNIILIDIDDSLCHAFANELVNDHTNHITDRQLPSLTAKWCWSGNEKEITYDDNHTRQIEAEFQRYIRTFNQTDLEICVNQAQESQSVYYLIQFYDWLQEDLSYNPNALNERLECGYQTNKKTNFIRPIIRYPLKQEKQSKSNDHKPLDIYQTRIEINTDDWQIIGITNSSTKQAELEMRKAIQTATITERFTVNLFQNINTHEKVIKDIVTQNLIEIEFEKDRTDKLTILLKGLRQNVSQAKLEILSYTNDILATTKDKDDELSIPKQWIEQEEECELVPLSKDDPEYIRIERRIKETMSGVKIHTIQRIQNVRLWNQYVFQRRILQQTLTHKSNSDIEMELFHGTRGTPPDEIYNGDCGFDMRFCSSGLWGSGSYFAKNASYSCQNYSYKLSDEKRQVFLAYVLVGDACDYGTKNDSSLRMPPKKDPKVSNVRYNSVTGETAGTRVYVVYNNNVTYPAFLITFSP